MGILYTDMKIFNFKEKVDSLPENVNSILPPVHIRIKPTNICNHNCRYCYYRSKDVQICKDMVKGDYIPKMKIMEITKDIIDMGVKAVTFSGGGEPFCYPYLIDVVKQLSKSPVKFASLTNGSLLKGELAEIFAHHGTWLRISIDGWDDESYSYFRGVRSGEFSKVLNNIRNFKKMKGKCCLGVSIIVNKKNSSHMFDLSKKLMDCGVDNIKISPCIVSDKLIEVNKYHEPIFIRVKKQVELISDKAKKCGVMVSDSYRKQLRSFKKEYKWCPFIQILTIIGADLNVYTCQDKAYSFDEGLLGSIRKRSFRDFWSSGKGKFFKVVPAVNCSHHCTADVKNKIIMDYLNADKEHLEFV